MTLTEYLAQETPARMPAVYLKPSEYKIRTESNCYYKGSSKKVSMKQIFINVFPGTEYVQIGIDTQLWTTDSDGNPKAYSCFRI